MISINIVKSILKNLFLNIWIGYVFIKITNYKKVNKKKILILSISSLVIAIIYAFFQIYFSVGLNTIVSILLIGFVISYITKIKIEEILFEDLLASGIAYIGFIFSVFIASFFADESILNISDNNPIGIFIINIIEFLLLHFFFKIKRFKNGFSFLKNDKYSNYKFISIMIIYILLVLYSSLEKYEKGVIQRIYGIFVLVSITFIIFIKKQITLSYKQMLKEDTITQLENDLEAEKIKNEKISNELAVLAKINHKYSTRISALESYVTTSIKKLNNNFDTEFADELLNAKTLIDNLSKEYTTELSEKFKYAKKIPKTNNLGLDNIINYLTAQANKDNIELNLKINLEINCLVDKLISQNNLETLIGDHVKDAIIAINHGDNKARNILLVFDKIDECYEIKIYDTGIEFEIETLLKLGLQNVTTHKDEGGSGIGFMTTFETLNECNSSLIIEEYENNSNNYTKSITIRFDGRKEYKIRSYRADKIKEQNTDERIIIENL